MHFHIPVLLKEVLEMLVIKRDGIYVDATAGFGGHSKGILSRLNDAGTLIAIDKDDAAINYLKNEIKDPRFTLLKGDFANLKNLLQFINFSKVDGILLDLGVSLYQLKELSRGFSFFSESRLDMRMDTSQVMDAWEVVNKYTQTDLERVFKEYGEERNSKRIAEAIVEERRKKTIDTCKELAKLIERIYVGRGKIHPATKVFQALRIEVNNELESLRKGLVEAYESLNTDGRLCVISYHSLEDRIVKNFLRDEAKAKNLRLLTKKPIQASTEERLINPSSRSAKLRGAQKI